MKESKFLALIASTGIALISSETQAATPDLIEDEEISCGTRSVPSIFKELLDERENSFSNCGCSNNGCSGGGSNNGCRGAGS